MKKDFWDHQVWLEKDAIAQFYRYSIFLRLDCRIPVSRDVVEMTDGETVKKMWTSELYMRKKNCARVLKSLSVVLLLLLLLLSVLLFAR